MLWIAQARSDSALCSVNQHPHASAVHDNLARAQPRRTETMLCALALVASSGLTVPVRPAVQVRTRATAPTRAQR